MEESGSGLAEIAKAFVIAREVFDLRGFVAAVEELDGAISTATQCELYVEFRRLMERTVRYLLSRQPHTADIGAEVGRYRDKVRQLSEGITGLYGSSGVTRFQERSASYKDSGAPDALAVWVASLLDGVVFLGVVDLASQLEADPEFVARGYLHLAEAVGVDDLLEVLATLPSEDRWDAAAKSALRQDVYRLTLRITADALALSEEEDAADRVALWSTRHEIALDDLRTTFGDLRDESSAGLGQMWVLVRDLGLLAGTPE